jgi:ABC-type dipeptide/oligopeptide/nickel transport system permease component/ABC-type transport system substrate-binding protein
VLFLERLASLRTLPGDLYAEYCVPAHYLRRYHPLYGDQALIARTMREKNIPTPRALYAYLKGWRNPDQPRLWPWIMRSGGDSPPYVFVRNPYYPAVDTRGNQLPYLDRLVMEVRPQALFDLSASAGQVSMQDRYIRYEDHVLLASAARRNGYHVYYWYPGNRSAFTIFPVINRRVDPARPDTAWKHRLLNDRRFRQALSLAIKRREIIDALFNGQGEPAQIDPGPQSEFFDARLFGSFTAYDPTGAGARLDALGLNHRDRDGYRTFPDGTRMTWYLSMTEATNNDPARFVIDDWAAVGVRCIPQIRGREIWYMQKGTLDQDFAVHHGESEFMPLIDPHNFVPTYGEAFYAPAYGYWYLFGGMDHSPGADVPRAIAPPPDHPLRRNMDLLDRIYRTPDPAERVALFRQIQDSDAEEAWTISIATPPPELVIVKDGFRNVPRTAVSEGSFETPGNAGLETYFWDHPHDPPAVIAALRQALIPPGATTAARPPPAVGVVTAVLRWSLAAAAALLVLAAARHPHVGRRLLLMVPTLFVLSIVIFGIVQLPPGDFATLREMEYASEGTFNSAQAIHELRATFHLDESLTSRYLRWTGLRWFATFKAADTGLLQGDLGRSMEYNRSVNAVIGNRILLTVLVTFASLFFTWIVALPAGIYCAARQYSSGDHLLTLLGFLGLSVPGFVLALVLMFCAHRYFGLAVSGLFSTEFATMPGWSWAKGVDLLKHIWIPVLVLGLGGAAGMMRVMRANLLDEIRKPYVTTARAKGLSETRLLLKYPVRLALNPLISSVGGQFPDLVSGGAIVAIVLSLPMVGPVLLDALLSQDVYLAGSLLMVLSVLAVAGTLISDLLLLWVDPRIRFERGGG